MTGPPPGLRRGRTGHACEPTAPAFGVRVAVRLASPSEHEAIAALTVGVYAEEGYAGPEYVTILADVAGRAASTDLLVAATPAGEVVGAVALATQGGPYAEGAGPDEAVFRMLVVDPSWRGYGVAAALVGECLRRARATGRLRMVISTEPRMHAAHRLYERLGLVRTPERDWSPVSGVDLLTYAIDL